LEPATVPGEENSTQLSTAAIVLAAVLSCEPVLYPGTVIGRVCCGAEL
jgi:hypothetical protein